jgi:PhnB protein
MIPAGYRTLTPSLTVHDAAGAIDFYKRAFDALELNRSPAPDGKRVFHAEVEIGDSRLMLSDEFPEMGGGGGPRSLGGTPVNLWMYVEDTDDVYRRAVEAGAKGLSPPSDGFWGDRWASVEDPFGHRWSIATRVEEVPEDELRRRVAAMAQGS